MANVNRMSRPKKAEPTEPMRLRRSMVKQIRLVSLLKGQDPADYVAERFRPLLDEDERELLKVRSKGKK